MALLRIRSVAWLCSASAEEICCTCAEVVCADSETCREEQTKVAKRKLDQLAKCTAAQMTDPGPGRVVPQTAAPCDVCIDGSGVIDTKCLRSCYELAVSEFSDGIVGDVAECGNGITQPGEFCDDGNTVNGDGCSVTCTVEAP